MSVNRAPELRHAVRRLTLEFTALILLVVLMLGTVVFGIVSRSVSEANQRALLDASLIDSPHDAPNGVWVAFVHDGQVQTSAEPIAGLPDRDALARAAGSRDPVYSTVTSGTRTFDVLTTTGPRGTVQLALDQHESREELGRLVWALAIASLIAAAGGAIAASWMARRTISPLVQALEMQRRFVADASHELRTPLTLLSTRAQLARRRHARAHTNQQDPAVGEDLDQIVADAGQLTAILEDLLVAADTRSVPAQDRVNVSEVARTCASAVQESARSRAIVVSASEPLEGAVVLASEAALQRMFTALLDNALDHAASRITVAVDVDHAHVTARVSDDGVGFDSAARARAFDRFATAREGQPEGSGRRHYGIGLALVAEVADRLGGSVWIDDAPGSAGAEIVVELPRARNP